LKERKKDQKRNKGEGLMETDAAVEKQRTVFPQPLAKRLGRFAQLPQARRLRTHLNNQFRVGQYCSIKVGQFYVVKKRQSRETGVAAFF
jgi:hypothetical protein